ncbi:hypothetical protein BOX15_Mlig000293g2 [Macrostomum lignano]|uniref:Caspase family p20 domain-containing protein n=1 Tax=Macrostomum lignano TaxID=282301 RepID=A0A267EPC1_9PLAT|nr:hypothetical protein BOX15_Mlig000293g2 [Macrostomum lignano]
MKADVQATNPTNAGCYNREATNEEYVYDYIDDELSESNKQDTIQQSPFKTDDLGQRPLPQAQEIPLPPPQLLPPVPDRALKKRQVQMKAEQEERNKNIAAVVPALKLKINVVGDEKVGKTCLLVAYAEGLCPVEYVPTETDDCLSKEVQVDGYTIRVGLWDNSGSRDYDRMRPGNYEGTDVVLICFSIASPATFDSVRTRWLPEIALHCSNTPIILVGTKMDALDDRVEMEKLHRKRLAPISSLQATALAKDIGAELYIECSALRRSGLDSLFKAAVRAAFEKQKKILEVGSIQEKESSKTEASEPHDQLDEPHRDFDECNEFASAQSFDSNDHRDVEYDVCSGQSEGLFKPHKAQPPVVPPHPIPKPRGIRRLNSSTEAQSGVIEQTEVYPSQEPTGPAEQTEVYPSQEPTGPAEQAEVYPSQEPTGPAEQTEVYPSQEPTGPAEQTEVYPSQEPTGPAEQTEVYPSQEPTGPAEQTEVYPSQEPRVSFQAATQKLNDLNRRNKEAIYPVTSPQGFCLIINIKKYRNRALFEERIGSELDVDRVKRLFTRLNFIVEVHEDLTCNELVRIVSLKALSPDLSNHGCFVCFIMAHGDESSIYGIDGEAWEVQAIAKRFRGNECTGLCNKPKLFFIQACRGKGCETIPGAWVDQQVSNAYYCPRDSDFVLCFATPSGQASLRNPTEGSPYVQTVCDVIEEMHKTEHLLDMLTIANDRLKKNPVLRDGNRLFVVSETLTRLSKKCFLDPGLASEFESNTEK